MSSIQTAPVNYNIFAKVTHNCPNCGSERSTIVEYTYDHNNIKECSDCGTQYYDKEE